MFPITRSTLLAAFLIGLTVASVNPDVELQLLHAVKNHFIRREYRARAIDGKIPENRARDARNTRFFENFLKSSLPTLAFSFPETRV